MVSIYSGENHHFHICNGEFDKFVYKTSEMKFFKRLYHFSQDHPYVKISWKCWFFVSHVGKIWKIFLVFFHFFGKFFWWKSQQVTFFCSFFTWKKNYMSVKLKKQTSSEKVIFFCKIYRHVRHSLILICTLMSAMGKNDQHFEKMF